MSIRYTDAIQQSASLAERYQKLQGRVEAMKTAAASTRARSDSLKVNQVRIQTAQAAIQAVARTTQEQLKYRVSDLATTALSTVFPEPYTMSVEFELKRGRSEARLRFLRGDNPVNPMDAAGGGAVDVAAFALRMSLWAILRNTARPVIILDEPFRYVSVGLLAAAGQLLRTVSDKLGVQLVVITHSPEIAATADRIFKVEKSGGESLVTPQ